MESDVPGRLLEFRFDQTRLIENEIDLEDRRITASLAPGRDRV
jgi:hypothetical protein